MASTLERARGRWREILPQLGIDTRFLTNKKGPCPICCPNTPNAKKFRWDDKNGTGSFYCNNCGPGGGYALVGMFKKLKGPKQILDAIDSVIGEEIKPKPIEKKNISGSSRLYAIKDLIHQANNPSIVENYLRSRGISENSIALRGHEKCPYFDEEGKFVGHFLAIIAPIKAPDGSLQSAQRIYIGDLDPRKKTMPPVNTIVGGAARLYAENEEMGIAEGIETALAAAELYGFPVWAAISAYGMETFAPPECVRRLHIFGDNDKSHTGQKAAHTLAWRLYHEKRETETVVHIPNVEGWDFNDALLETHNRHNVVTFRR